MLMFSVVMPIYNSEKFLKEALDSISAQTFHNYEIVLINNGSTDSSEEIINDFVLNNPELKVNIIKLNPNKGISYARNIGAEKSVGKYIAFIDSDDIWFPDKLKKVNEIVNQNDNIDIIWHWENHMSEKSDIVVRYKKLDNDRAYEELLFHRNELSTSATVVRKEIFMKISGFDLKYVNGEEDYDCWLRLARENAVFYLIQESLGVFRIHGESTSSRRKVHSDAIIAMLSSHFDWMKQHKAYNDKFIIKKFNSRRAEFDFSYGHYLSTQKQRKEAMIYYIRSLKERPLWWKVYIGILLLPFCK